MSITSNFAETPLHKDLIHLSIASLPGLLLLYSVHLRTSFDAVSFIEHNLTISISMAPRDPSPGHPIEFRDDFVTQGRLRQDYDSLPGIAPRQNIP